MSGVSSSVEEVLGIGGLMVVSPEPVVGATLVNNPPSGSSAPWEREILLMTGAVVVEVPGLGVDRGNGASRLSRRRRSRSCLAGFWSGGWHGRFIVARASSVRVCLSFQVIFGLPGSV